MAPRKRPKSPSIQRTKLVRPVVLSFLLAVLAGGFALLYPNQQEWRRLATVHVPDAISVAYLRVLVIAQPNDSALKLALMQRLIDHGQLDEAQALASALAQTGGAVGLRTRVAQAMIELASAIRLPVSDAARKVRQAQAADSLARLLEEPLAIADLVKLAEASLAAERPDVAARAYQRLAGVDAARREHWYASAARWYEASLQPALAGDLYHAAFLASAQGKREYALKGLAAWQAAGKLRDSESALTRAAQYLTRHRDDNEILQAALQFAIATGDAARAAKWGRRWLALAPKDPERVRQQLQRELAQPDLDAALALAERWVELRPEQMDAHEQLAQIAEWASQPALAAQHYAWLARHGSAGSATDRAIGLATQLGDVRLLIQMLTSRSRTRALAAQELSDLAWAYEREREPLTWIEFLRTYTQRYPDQQVAWQRLAQAQEARGRLMAAAATWHRVVTRFGYSPEAAQAYASLLVRTKQPEAAYAVLRRLKPTYDDVSYWRAYADLAWELKRNQDAYAVYAKLWHAGKADLLGTERLILLAQRTGQRTIAIETAEQAYRRFSEPRLLFVALEASVRDSDWDGLKRLLDVAGKDEQRFAKQERYWLLKAHSDAHAGAKAAALADYARALELNSASKAARVGWLWLALDTPDAQPLATRLRDWQSDAERDPAYWGAYAAAFLALNRPRESLPWFERQAGAKPRDHIWLLSYADALNRAGRKSEGWRLRRHVYLSLRADRLRGAKTHKEQASQRAYASLLEEFAGAPSANKAIRALLRENPDDPQVRELLVAHHLAEKNYGAARYWLQRAQAEHQNAPAWERLAVAFADGDNEAIERLLGESSLSGSDRVEALHRLGRDRQALAEAHKQVSGE